MATTNRVADMTIDELRQLIRDTVRDLLAELRESGEAELLAEFAAWEAASDEDLRNFEAGLSG